MITRTGGPEVIEIQQRPDPVPGAGQVLIDVRAAGVNFADIQARLGFYPDAPKLPAVVGYEVAGTVAALGPGVSGIEVGTRVAAGTRFGGYAERAVAAVGDLVELPASMSFGEGAAIPVVYATAVLALRTVGNLQPGERALFHSAGGGVGIAATQIAKSIGAEVWGTASPGKHEAIRGFGVDHPLDYTRAGWEKAVPPMDLIIDGLGGASFRRSYRLLGAGGRMVCIGASAVVSGDRRDLVSALRTIVRMPRFNLVKQMSDSKAVIGLNMLRIWDARGSLERETAALLELLGAGVVKPVVAAEFPLERAGEAHAFIAARRNVGKVVLST